MKNYQKVLINWVCLSFLITYITPLSISAQHFTGIMNSYHKYDHDKDGIFEIDGLKYVSFDAKSKSPSTEDGLVLVLVEDRLFENIPGSKYSAEQLIKQLKTYKSDLQKDGLDSRFVITNIYNGKEHQDGLTTIALREWIREIYKHWNLKAVVLVGNYPDAMLVRRWIWRKFKKDIEINGKEQKGVDYLRMYPEVISDRSDLVLADMDGNWDKIYVKKKTDLELIEALPDASISNDWPNNDKLFVSTSFNRRSLPFEDFFWIDDDAYQVIPTGNSELKIRLSTSLRNPEISEDDKSAANPIAKPDILVSRINPYHIAVEFGHPSANGLSFLDNNRKPRKYETTSRLSKSDYIKRDAAIERQLLMEYFDRNHNHRNGDNSSSHKDVASISYGSGVDNAQDVLSYLIQAVPFHRYGYIKKSANLLDYFKFLQFDANLKGIVAHSSSMNSEFGEVHDLKDFSNQLGGHIYRWKRTQNGQNYVYTPTIEDNTGRADAYFHRTVYENGLLSNTNPCFYIHMGCQVNSPQNFRDMPYSDIQYSNTTGEQNSESMLFFANGLAMASRAKVFNDRPNGFTAQLSSYPNKRFGDGLVAYHKMESNNAALANQHAQCKRPYTWSIIGDCTLKLTYEEIKQ